MAEMGRRRAVLLSLAILIALAGAELEPAPMIALRIVAELSG
jgi:hypothetical protein